MPGLGDKRALGISQLLKVVNEGLYTGLPAAATLVRIYIEEKRYEEAENLVKRILRKYPGNRNFSFDLAEIYFLTGRYNESEKLYTTILDRSDAEAFNNNINSLRCRTFLAKIYEKKKVYYKALAECRRALRYTYNQTDKIVAKEYMAEVRTVMKNVKKVYKIVR
jgi:tetratricopeptide (TPR) repeat protein